MMITIDPEDGRLSKSERDFLRRIALNLQADAQRRRLTVAWLPSSVDHLFNETLENSGPKWRSWLFGTSYCSWLHFWCSSSQWPREWKG